MLRPEQRLDWTGSIATAVHALIPEGLMPTEIEAKMQVGSHDGVIAGLRDAAATHHVDIFEHNVFFDSADGTFRAGDIGLRIRSERHTPPGGESKSVINLTYKGPRAAGPLKQREEIEYSVSDLDDAVTVMQRIGFEITIRFEKRRQRWKLDGCSIELDELPHLGCFVEVEGPDAPTVEAVREKIGLADTPTSTDSYAHMLADYATKNGLDLQAIHF